MWAMGVDEADRPIRIAKGQQILAQQAHAHRRTIFFRDFLAEHGWLPVAAEQFPGGRSRPHPDQAFVLLSRQHGVFSPIYVDLR